MSKVAHYLQEHLVGEVITSPDARRYFSTDTSIFTLTPAIVVYPRNENDVRKTARFTWQLAERGRVIPITARGSGTDQTGAALGSGVMLVFPAHMNKVLELDPKSGSVAVQPGLNYGKLQQTLHTHGRFLPPYPASLEYCTIGGSVANNAAGEKTVKYGTTRKYVRSLRVVLANGEVIETRRVNKRELNKIMGLNTMEGEIYRKIDQLIEENKELIEKSSPKVEKNSAGYALDEVKRKDGSFDITPLIVGSQGTLGIVTEAILETEPFNPHSSLVMARFDSLEEACKAVVEIRDLAAVPSAMEMVDENLIKFIEHINPNQLKGLIEKPYPKIVLLIEFDDANNRVQKEWLKTRKIIERYNGDFKVEEDIEQKDRLWKIRHSAASVVSYQEGNTKALPIIEDGIVPVDKLNEYINGIYAIFERLQLSVAVWGHAGSGNLHMQPMFDISQLGDRQKIFRLLEDYHQLVVGLGGSISAEHGDGRIRGPYLPLQFGSEYYDVLTRVKAAFDPHGTLNPGVKIGITTDDIKPLLRSEYSISHLYDHLPRS